MDGLAKVYRRQAEEGERKAAERREQRLSMARASILENGRAPAAYIHAARCCKESGQLYEALAILEKGIGQCAPDPALHEYYVERLEKCNRTEEAIAAAREAARLFPDELIFTLREALMLPVFYDTTRQVQHVRDRFTEGLSRIVQDVPLDTAVARRRALKAVARTSNKYLPYQGRNDRELQMMYGAWLQQVMTMSFPERALPVRMPPLKEKIRIGYLSALSARFLGTSSDKLFGGWIREHDRRQFDIVAYHADRGADPAAESVRRWGISFRQLSGDVHETAQAILADRLHVLVYVDFGIHPRMAQLAALRLAPIQCVAWDTPLTSGVPAMDYFLSSRLMEPDDAQDHYSEELVALPGVGVCFAKPVVPTVILTKTRRDFGLREDAVIYVSCQSVFKYSPGQDVVVAQIAARVPNSQFVFLATNEVVEKDFKGRMNRAFADAGLRAADHCLWLREMDVLDFWNLHLIADASLDTLYWSGGVTTFEAVACGLPVVTLPGTLMRGRHSSAIFTQLGVTETIARDEEEYVSIAVRLGLDRQWRQRVVDRMVAGYPTLYSDTRSVRALEDFFSGVVEGRLRGMGAAASGRSAE
jgi:predicted O-linked N-acetylglucosamine transferase (SPINDLY family)